MVKDLFEALDRIVAWLGLVGKRRGERNAQLESALAAVMIAANKTRSYLALLRVRSASSDLHLAYQDRDAEATQRELTRAWEEAGRQLARLEDDDTRWLARRCFEKSAYWADPQHIKWEDDAVVEAAGIQLDGIVNDILDFFCGSRQPLSAISQSGDDENNMPLKLDR